MGDMCFHEYFAEWIETYKAGAIRPVTLQKYTMTLKHLKALAPTLKMSELNKRSYQTIINVYAQTHEKQTVTDFHNQLKAAALDALDEGVISASPCRNTVVKGIESGKEKKIKALSADEFNRLLGALNFPSDDSRNCFIYFIAKTGARFAEALAVTPNDFDFERKTVSITKSFDYKSGSVAFIPTKTKSSIRKVVIDDRTCGLLKGFMYGKDVDKPIFATLGEKVFNSTYNTFLSRVCKAAGVPAISIHGLRHTHASVLFSAGVSVLSVSKRLGHANVNITQSTYLHIIKELEDKDTEKIIGFLSAV